MSQRKIQLTEKINKLLIMCHSCRVFWWPTSLLLIKSNQMKVVCVRSLARYRRMYNVLICANRKTKNIEIVNNGVQLKTIEAEKADKGEKKVQYTYQRSVTNRSPITCAYVSLIRINWLDVHCTLHQNVFILARRRSSKNKAWSVIFAVLEFCFYLYLILICRFAIKIACKNFLLLCLESQLAFWNSCVIRYVLMYDSALGRSFQLMRTTIFSTTNSTTAKKN